MVRTPWWPGVRAVVRFGRRTGTCGMEEASVAGESPDRSKQRESSAEPTSGSAGPVPEARREADDYKGVNRRNWNELVGSNNVVGIKTGTTTSALGNLVFAAKKDVGGETHTIVGAVVRQPPGGKDNDHPPGRPVRG
ncbi:hypothetical protein SGLAM104S_07470 [Streptomyces glaucescens]